jgi:hypothetical protein
MRTSSGREKSENSNAQPSLRRIDIPTHRSAAQYAERQRFAVQPSPRAVQFTCEDDLYRHYKLLHYVHGDNTTCTHQPQAPFLPPGYGGAFDGTVSD